jgi:hypothetical protein
VSPRDGLVALALCWVLLAGASTEPPRSEFESGRPDWKDTVEFTEIDYPDGRRFYAAKIVPLLDAEIADPSPSWIFTDQGQERKRLVPEHPTRLRADDSAMAAIVRDRAKAFIHRRRVEQWGRRLGVERLEEIQKKESSSKKPEGLVVLFEDAALTRVVGTLAFQYRTPGSPRISIEDELKIALPERAPLARSSVSLGESGKRFRKHGTRPMFTRRRGIKYGGALFASSTQIGKLAIAGNRTTELMPLLIQLSSDVGFDLVHRRTLQTRGRDEITRAGRRIKPAGDADDSRDPELPNLLDPSDKQEHTGDYVRAHPNSFWAWCDRLLVSRYRKYGFVTIDEALSLKPPVFASAAEQSQAREARDRARALGNELLYMRQENFLTWKNEMRDLPNGEVAEFHARYRQYVGRNVWRERLGLPTLHDGPGTFVRPVRRSRPR